MPAQESSSTWLGRNWPWAAVAAAVALAGLLWTVSGRSRDETPGEMLQELRRAAREREVARMVAGLEGVRSADILLRERNGGSPAGASVTLELAAGHVLGPETASAVAGLVASSVPGLDPAEIVVVDARDPARTHRLAPDADVAHEGAAVLRLRAQVERALAEKIRGLFAGMQIECVAVVSAELDLDSIEERLVEIDPKDRGEFVVREETAMRDRGSATVGTPSALSGASPARRGAVANRPASLSPSAARAGSPVETRTREFEIGRLTSEITRRPRGLADVNASVVIFDRVRQAADGSWEYDRDVGSDENVKKYTQLVARALGLDPEQEGHVALQYMPSPWLAPPEAAVAGRGPGAAGYLAIAALVVAGAVVAYAAQRSFARRTGAAAAEAERPQEEPWLRPPAELPVRELRLEATRAASEDTERAAAILHRWIAREGVS
jgi:flagellar biosynthesis/type III secretory pathway M-ring protein FliF/YscJ